MRITSLLLFGLLLSGTTLAQAPPKITKATVAFRIKNAGLNVNGTFGGFQGVLLFDPASPEKGSLTASVDAATVDTGIKLRNEHLRKPEYFDVAAHPRISLKSTRLAAKGGNAFTGTFDLTMKGNTRAVTIPFTFVNGQFDGSFVIDRRDYGVGKNSLIMGDNVTITIQVQTAATPQ
jgi:polyisoprenoid-binding protein YceI